MRVSVAVLLLSLLLLVSRDSNFAYASETKDSMSAREMQPSKNHSPIKILVNVLMFIPRKIVQLFSNLLKLIHRTNEKISSGESVADIVREGAQEVVYKGEEVASSVQEIFGETATALQEEAAALVEGAEELVHDAAEHSREEDKEMSSFMSEEDAEEAEHLKSSE